jgi:hypothetical protein
LRSTVLRLHCQIAIGFFTGLVIGYITNVAKPVGGVPYQICDAVGAVVVGRLEGARSRRCGAYALPGRGRNG